MKHKITALLLGATLIPAVVIAGGHFGEKRDGHRLERMTEHLQLNEQQQAEVKQILDAQREQRRALREETQQRIQSVLSEEQRATMAKHREQRRKRSCDHEEGKGHHGRSQDD